MMLATILDAATSDGASAGPSDRSLYLPPKVSVLASDAPLGMVPFQAPQMAKPNILRIAAPAVQPVAEQGAGARMNLAIAAVVAVGIWWVLK